MEMLIVLESLELVKSNYCTMGMFWSMRVLVTEK